MKIKYTSGYKYQLYEDASMLTPIKGAEIYDKFFTLYKNGFLQIKEGFAWDGASGPTFDTKNSMSPSLVHDVFCYSARTGRLDFEKYRHEYNDLFKQMCIDNGMSGFRSNIWHAAVEFANAGDPEQGPDRVVQEAP
jgi:hypothetical protein